MKGNVRKILRNSHLGKRMSALFLCAALTLGMAACGESGDGTEDGGVSNGSGEQDTAVLIYEPEGMELGNDGEYSLYNSQFLGDMFCSMVYLEDDETGGSYVLRCQSLTEETVKDIPMLGYASVWTLGEDGSLYTIHDEVSGGENGENFHLDKFLIKQTQLGEQVFRQDITELFSGEDFIQMELAADAGGRTYLLTEDVIYLFDEEGNAGGTVRLNLSGEIYDYSFGRGSDGKVYLSDGFGSTTLYEVEYEAAQLGDGYTDFPAYGGSALSWDVDGNYLTLDNMGVYRYNIKDKKQEKVFDMVDTGIEAVMLSAIVGGLSDGRIAIVWQDWETKENGIVFMTGKDAPELTEGQKKELILGVMNSDSFLAAAVNEFNKKSDTYKITIKTYMKPGEIYMIDGVTRLQTDIAAGNCPDIFEVDTYTMDWKNLVEKGVFEDLAPYLEQSEVLKREEMLESVLDAYTYEGVLATIPAVIQIQGFFGSADELGDKTGWTIDDVIAFSDAHPDAELLDGATATYIMRFCLSYSMDSFVDWEHGTCSFDGDEFKRLLEFVARFSKPLSTDSGTDQKPWREKVGDGELLLRDVDMYEVNNVQVYADPFPGGVTAIGYPSPDGSPVYTFYGTDALAISARSEAKEAAWNFIENYLTRDGHRFHAGFPVIKDKLDEMIDEAMEVKLDENGNEIKSQLVLGDGLTYIYRRPTQEEIDMILYMIDHGKPTEYSSTQLMNIINEEADAFFQGQKTVDQVAEAIQSRASIYVSENS